MKFRTTKAAVLHSWRPCLKSDLGVSRIPLCCNACLALRFKIFYLIFIRLFCKLNVARGISIVNALSADKSSFRCNITLINSISVSVSGHNNISFVLWIVLLFSVDTSWMSQNSQGYIFRMVLEPLRLYSKLRKLFSRSWDLFCAIKRSQDLSDVKIYLIQRVITWQAAFSDESGDLDVGVSVDHCFCSCSKRRDSR